jgi:hypothetical protein
LKFYCTAHPLQIIFFQNPVTRDEIKIDHYPFAQKEAKTINCISAELLIKNSTAKSGFNAWKTHLEIGNSKFSKKCWQN